MATQVYSTDAIRAMDGEALAQLAWEHGLAPADAVWQPRPGVFARDLVWQAMPWEPNVNLAQADTVFRRLRELGYHTRMVAYSPAGGMIVAHQHSCPAVSPHTVFWGEGGHGEGDTSEAMALLRCAVLAVASAEAKEQAC